jgi:tRNA threonylcarbamoyladenosine biosynthesis protein TsaE
MKKRSLVTRSAEETSACGVALAATLSPGAVVGLVGPLGAGKTVMIKGMCRGLEYDGIVTSPTFSLINIYGGQVEIYHFDCYRLDGVRDLEDIGYEEYFFGEKGICLIEWADRVADALPDDIVIVQLEILAENERKITIGSPATVKINS